MSLAAREYFPRGLKQPENGFRFSVDALILACFAQPKKRARVLDLGTGCGVVSFGFLMREETMTALGLDAQQAMAEAAKGNAAALGLDGRYSVALGNVKDIRELEAVGPESFDVVVCNPPYREPGRGRVSPEADRNIALFEEQGSLSDFLRAAAYALKNRQAGYFVYGAERLEDFMREAGKARLTVKRLRFVHGRAGAPAKLALIEVRKNGKPGLSVEPPLVLYGEGPGRGSLTGEALAFCPYLGCNA